MSSLKGLVVIDKPFLIFLDKGTQTALGGLSSCVFELS